MAIRMRRGNEADFDPSKMLPGEWAVSTDTKYVRMCFSPGIVLRMATYEAFESDMAEIRKILSECKSIQTAVKLIQQNVTNSELVIENYVKEAKQYRDEAEQFRNEASMFAPEGYEDLVKNVSDNTVKIDTIIEKAELNIKNNAKGNNIHLTDSAESNVVALELYGKTEQNAYTGKNLLDCSGLSETTSNGVTFTPVYDGNGSLECINVNGTANANVSYKVGNVFNPIVGQSYTLNGCPSGGSNTTYKVYADQKNSSNVTIEGGVTLNDLGSGATQSIVSECTHLFVAILIRSGVALTNAKFYPMISVEGGEYEPYVGGKPSPSPSYPQEIKSVKGKNLLDCRGLVETTNNGVKFTPVYDNNGNLLYVNVNGTASATAAFRLDKVQALKEGKYILSGCPSGGSNSTYRIRATRGLYGQDTGNGLTSNYTVGENLYIYIEIASGYTTNNLKFYPMIRPVSITDDTYVPYGLLRINTQGKNFVDDTDITSWYKPANSSVYRKVFKLKPNTECTISQIKDSDSGSALIFAISGIDLDFTPSTSENGCTVGNSRTVTSSINGYITIGLYENSKGYCQLEECSTATEYQQYQSTEVTLSKPIELNGFNGVYDTVTSEGVTRKFAEVRVLSSFDWTVIGGDAGADGHCFQTRLYSELLAKNTNEYILTNALCTHFIIKKSGDLYFKSSDEIGDGIAIWQNTNGYNIIRCRNTDCSSLADFKTWLNENEVYLLYELATPTTEALQTDFTVLKTFYPETHVSNDADCDMSITYTADAKNYIDNKIALLTTAIYNNI